MSAGSGLCAAGEPDLPDGGTGNVCDDADDEWSSERAVRSAVEPGGLRILPERSNEYLSGIHVRDRYPATETREDGDHGSNAGV